MNTNQGFEKVHVSEFFRLRTFGANNKSFLKSGPYFFFIISLHPFKQRCYISLFKGYPCCLHNGTIKRIAMGKGIFVPARHKRPIPKKVTAIRNK